MPWTPAQIPDQTGRVAIVTGANSGIGFHTARHLAQRGAEVILACRNMSKAESAIGRIREGCPTAAVRASELDLSELASVAAFSERTIAEQTRIDLLINNAGIMIPPHGQNGADRPVGPIIVRLGRGGELTVTQIGCPQLPITLLW